MNLKPILILHLSDLHFGKNSRFSGHDPIKLGKMFCQAINEEREHRKFPSVGLVIVTGDIAEAALPEEYNKAKIFFDTLVEEFPLKRKYFIFTPGNHDVSWDKCKEIENKNKGVDYDTAKFEYFEKFLKEFYNDDRKNFAIAIDKNAYIYNFNELNISIGALNSCELESHLKQQGCVSESQLNGIMQYWHKNYSFLKIVAIHHNPDITPQENIQAWIDKIEQEGKLELKYLKHFITDITGLEGNELLKNLVEDCQVPLVLHGHQHSSYYKIWSWRNKGETHLISAGSMGLKQGDLPKDQTNNTQLILLNPNNKTMRVCSLVYNPKARGNGILSPGYFVPDNTHGDCYEKTITWEHPFLMDGDHPKFNFNIDPNYEYADIVNRNDIVNNITNILNTDERIIYLYGLPKIGKTSILKNLQNTLKIYDRPALIDFNGWSSISKQNAFLYQLANNIDRNVLSNIKIGKFKKNDGADDFEKFIHELCKVITEQKKKLVLMFDEIEYVITQETDKMIFDFLINLIDKDYPIKFIFTGSIDMFNKFNNCSLGRILHKGKRIQVGCYDETISECLLDKNSRGFFTFENNAKKRILFLTDGHPMLLECIFNIIADGWVTHKRNIITEHDVNEAFNLIIKDRISYTIKSMFSMLPMDKQRLIRELSKYRYSPLQIPNQESPNDLVEWQIIKFESSKYYFRIGLLAESILNGIIPN